MSNEKTYEFLYKSPIGFLRIVSNNNALIRLDFVDDDEACASSAPDYFPEIIKKTVSELSDYFSGSLKQFTVKLQQETTAFRQSVYGELVKIPYGSTVSYREIAERLGRPKASRAVGGANHNNKIPIIVPCHRVLGANGSLTGYAGGLSKKEFLLELERKNA